MGSAARMAFYIVPAALLCMLYGDSDERPGRAAYRTAPETGSLIVKRLEENALSPSEVPPELRNKLRYFDFDRDGLLESRLAWDNLYGPDAYLIMEKDGKGVVVFPELSANAVRPDEKPAALSVDYHSLDGTGKTESIMYVMARDLYPGNPLDFSRKPIMIERHDGRYYWNEIPRGNAGNGGNERYIRPSSPKPFIDKHRVVNRRLLSHR